jgi:hypothetical protein
MPYIEDAKESDFEDALRLIYERASLYEGPRAREFLEIARRSAPAAIDFDSEKDELVETRDPKEQFSEVLALLYALAFPPDRQDEKHLRSELARVLEKKRINSLRFREGDRIIKIADHLRKNTPKAERDLQQMLSRFLQQQDKLHADEEDNG